MAKRPTRHKRATRKATRPRATRRDALPRGDGAPGYTTAEVRGRQFFDKLRMWQTFHNDGGRTIFTKTTLAHAYFGDELAGALRRAEHGEGDDTRERVLERYRKSVQRTVVALQNMDVPILDVNRDGTPIDLDEVRPAGGRDRERRWKYDATCHRAEALARLARPTGLPAWEIVGMLACEELIRDLSPSRATAGVRSVTARIRREVPPEFYEEASRQARAWRHGLGDPVRYAAKRGWLAAWNRATLDRHQVRILYATPGKPPKERTLAAFGTRFAREEDAVYLIGAEADGDTRGAWRRPVPWKLDRVQRLEPLRDRPNPDSSALPSHELLNHAASATGTVSGVDVERLYADSVGGFYSYDIPPIRLEMVVHDPSWIAWCLEKPFHPNQQVRHESLPGGGAHLRIVVDRCHEAEMVYRLLRLGDSFTVESPPSLVAALLDRVRGIQSRHRR